MAEYITIMVINNKTQEEITSELEDCESTNRFLVQHPTSANISSYTVIGSDYGTLSLKISDSERH
jgi:hypothetical protein